jgi:hypothetical protein
MHTGGFGYIALLTLKLCTKWIEWPASGSVCLNPGKRTPCNLLKIMLDELSQSQCSGEDKKKLCLLPGFHPQIIQPVA